MSNWYTRITVDLSVIPDFISYYESELPVAKNDVNIKGNVEKNIAGLPGVTEHRFNQLQEIEAVLNYLNIQLRKNLKCKLGNKKAPPMRSKNFTLA